MLYRRKNYRFNQALSLGREDDDDDDPFSELRIR